VRVCAAQKAGPGISPSHAARHIGFAASLLIVGSVGLQQAKALGDSRTISLHNVHTGEDLRITYKKNGDYDQDALNKINWILRDWRKNQAIKMDPQEIDLLWEVYREVGAKEPINIICGYRSPDTNAMLRRRSKGVARFSQHTLGKAIDFFIPGVPLDRLRATAMRLQGGGVGYYPASGSPFVHLDVGNVRAWPRMTREQLVKLFPDGRTVHVPSDGKPLPGYQLALADLGRNGNQRTADPPKKRSLIAALFGIAQDAEETDDNAAVRQNAAVPRSAVAKPAKPKPAPTVVATAATTAPSNTPVPLPLARPIYQIASAESRPAPPLLAAPVKLAALSPNEIVNSRGYWETLPEAKPQTTAASEPRAHSISAARRILASSLTAAAGHDLTATVGPFARPDRIPSNVALAYAALPETAGLGARVAPMARPFGSAPPPALVTRKGSASIAVKPAETVPHSRLAKTADRLNDPWLRGMMLAATAQNALTVTPFGDPDYARLAQYMHKPNSTVMMTFSHDPHLGMVTEAFSGGAVVFQATVTFTPQRTAALP
jgi:uncharacterized protein YcbK (DUF882 family)